ncbi:hypothetical protein ACIPUD_10490 [Bradyrhizobium sp. CAR08]
MPYDYIQRTYGVTPIVGERIKHHVVTKGGTITKEDPSASHYVQVLFDGDRHPLPCHPTEMDYLRTRR